MKDNAVEPAGLFDIRRQRRLLNGLVNRFRGSLSKQQMLQAGLIEISCPLLSNSGGLGRFGF